MFDINISTFFLSIVQKKKKTNENNIHKVAKMYNGIVYRGTVPKDEPTSRDGLFKATFEDGDHSDWDKDELDEAIEYHNEMDDTFIKSSIPLREYQNKKSVWYPSIDFLNYLGRCREKEDVFHWYTDKSNKIDCKNIILYETNLGRVYFDRFVLHGIGKTSTLRI